jgi:hypothetical protein
VIEKATGWCLWASLVVVMMLIGLLVVATALGLTLSERVIEVLSKPVQIGSAGAVALYLLGIVCRVVGQISGQLRRR